MTENSGSQSNGSTGSDFDSVKARVVAKVALQGGGSKKVTVEASSTDPVTLLNILAQQLGVSFDPQRVAIIANGQPADEHTRLTGEENLVVAAPHHANG